MVSVSSGPMSYCIAEISSFDGFLSLGFGRPQSLGIGSISEHSFLQLGSSGQNGTHIRSDMYIASMVQLTQVSGAYDDPLLSY